MHHANGSLGPNDLTYLSEVPILCYIWTQFDVEVSWLTCLLRIYLGARYYAHLELGEEGTVEGFSTLYSHTITP